MVKVGITGGIGSGKSVVARLLATLGYKTYDCDRAATRLMLEDSVLKKQLTALLGSEAYLDDGSLNKKIIAAKVFNDPAVRKQINAIVHPAVIGDFLVWCRSNSSEEILFVESAILIESGLIAHVDKSIMVCTPVEERMQRIVERDNISRAAAQERIASQMPDSEKTKLCDFIIDNSRQTRVLPQVTAILSKVADFSF